MAAPNQSQQQMYSMQITNIMGFPFRAPFLVVEEYDHWKVRMERFLVGKEKGGEILRYVKEVSLFPVRQMVRDATATLMDQDELRHVPLTTNDIEKLHVDQIAFSKVVFGVSPSLFEYIK